jgi:hypothetical protein
MKINNGWRRLNLLSCDVDLRHSTVVHSFLNIDESNAPTVTRGFSNGVQTNGLVHVRKHINLSIHLNTVAKRHL